MDSTKLAQLRDCCRDQAAFEKLQEFLATESCDPLQFSQQKVLFRVIAKIRESLDLETIFKSTATEVRQLLDADRVGVFRFYADAQYDDGEFVSEDVLPEFPSALEAKIHDHCFGQQHAVHYQQGRIQAVADIHNAGLQPCHVEVLSQFQIRANLIVPLLQGDRLWGLLCIHQCATSRTWRDSEIEFVTQIATQLSIAIQQAELLAKTQQKSDELTQALEQLKQAQTHLIQQEKMSSLGQLVAGVAHEINNPVNFIYGNLSYIREYSQTLLSFIQLYQTHYPDVVPEIQARADEVDLEFLQDDLSKLLDSMKLGTNRIRQIVLSLRNFSRMDEAEFKLVNIHDGIDSTLLILQHRLKDKSNRLAIQIVKDYGELPEVECYAGQLNQVFMNILANAIDELEESYDKHTHQNLEATPSQIIIRTSVVASNWVQIAIADTGRGMSETIRQSIFNPFFTTKALGKGTGMGLSISYQIVTEKHHGKLECLSEPGQGTEFVIRIPIRQG